MCKGIIKQLRTEPTTTTIPREEIQIRQQAARAIVPKTTPLAHTIMEEANQLVRAQEVDSIIQTETTSEPTCRNEDKESRRIKRESNGN